MEKITYSLRTVENKIAFKNGLRDGIPIALGYFAVAFSLGIMAKHSGLSPFQGFLTSALCLASAGEYVGFTLIAAAAVGLGCILVCADQLGGASFTPWKLLNLPETSIRMWNDCWLDFFDMLSEGVMMPFGALLMSLMIGWEVGPDMVKDECEQSGHAMGGYGFFKVCVKYITPLCMILILYGQLTDFFG